MPAFTGCGLHISNKDHLSAAAFHLQTLTRDVCRQLSIFSDSACSLSLESLASTSFPRPLSGTIIRPYQLGEVERDRIVYADHPAAAEVGGSGQGIPTPPDHEIPTYPDHDNLTRVS